MSDPVTRYLFGCCSYEFSWVPGEEAIEYGWGTEQEAIAHSFVSSQDYDSLRAKVAEQEATIAELKNILAHEELERDIARAAAWGLKGEKEAQAATIERLEAALRFVQSCAVQCPACKQYVDAALNEQEKP